MNNGLSNKGSWIQTPVRTTDLFEMLVLNFIGNSRRALRLKKKLGKLYQPLKQWHVVFEVVNTHQIIFYSERPVLSSDNDDDTSHKLIVDLNRLYF